MSSLMHRRIHIAGSIAKDADRAEVARACQVIEALVAKLVAEGATFVLPIDCAATHSDGTPVTFDWLVFDTIAKNLNKRKAHWSSESLIVAVNHNKTREQLPPQFAEIYDDLRANRTIQSESAHHWNMNSKRMDIQALHGDILITVGGDEGVLYLANLYHETARPVVPLNFALSAEDKGSRKLFGLARTREYADRFVQLQPEGGQAHGWFDRLDFSERQSITACADTVMELLRHLERPTAFAIRLLNPDDPHFKAVDDHFTGVVQSFVENDLGFCLVVIDAFHSQQEPFINQEIFNHLHRAQLVIADLTSLRPNCLIELGYALGRQRRTLVMVKKEKDFHLPFDISAVDTDFWDADKTLVQRHEQLKGHWERVQNRRSIVSANPLVP